MTGGFEHDQWLVLLQNIEQYLKAKPDIML